MNQKWHPDCELGSQLGSKPQPVKTTVTTRMLNRVNCESFKCDLLPRFQSWSCSIIQELVDLYENSIRNSWLHAPLKTSVRSDRPRQPWYNNEIETGRDWRKSILQVHRQLYVDQRKRVDLIDQAKQDHYHDYRKELEGADTKTFFKILFLTNQLRLSN